MRRLSPCGVTAILGLGLALGLTFAPGGAQAEATLRHHATVSGAFVTLGDLITEAGWAANSRVIAAPAPGEFMIVRRRLIERVASSQKLDFSGEYPVVRVTRASQIVPSDEILVRLQQSLEAAGLDGRYQIEMGKRKAIRVALDQEPTVRVENLQYNRRSGRFRALLVPPQAANEAPRRYRVSGQAHAMVEVPVLNAPVKVGQVIGRDDVDWIEIRSRRLNRNQLLDIDDLIGLTPRRPVKINEPLRRRDLQRPVVVAKGELVTIIVSIPGMTLMVTGRASDKGSMGDVIRVVNTQTHKTVEAVVMAPGRVRVAIRNHQLAQLRK
jgi:flagella basal body P-ring formation protein FlgA|tara:strand:+ start:214 stop:1188 length:975 start_codon:yes stop_codon:yes gene_type:complete